MTKLAGAAFVALVLLGSPTYAQPPAVPDERPPVPSDQQPLLSSEDLPVSLERIKRRLAQVPSDKRDLMRIQFYVEVYGRAPADLFASFDLHNGPVPYGAPTHQEILAIVTPQEFRSPPADLLTSVRTLLDWLTRRDKDQPEKR